MMTGIGMTLKSSVGCWVMGMLICNLMGGGGGMDYNCATIL